MKFDIEKAVKKLNTFKCQNLIAVALGSGLYDIANVEGSVSVSYESLGLVASKVEGHTGQFIFAKIKDKNVVFFTRYHYYEYGDLRLVRAPYEILSRLGVKTVILTTSTGGLRKDLKIGDIMLISDHINLSGVNPFINDDVIRFFPIDKVYDESLQTLAKSIAKDLKLNLKTGVHVQLSGPCYETLAEVKMLGMLGGSTVSMSTALDAIVCAYYDMKVLGFSVVTDNLLLNCEELTHEKVLEVGKESAKKLKGIILAILEKI